MSKIKLCDTAQINSTQLPWLFNKYLYDLTNRYSRITTLNHPLHLVAVTHSSAAENRLSSAFRRFASYIIVMLIAVRRLTKNTVITQYIVSLLHCPRSKPLVWASVELFISQWRHQTFLLGLFEKSNWLYCRMMTLIFERDILLHHVRNYYLPWEGNLHPFVWWPSTSFTWRRNAAFVKWLSTSLT